MKLLISGLFLFCSNLNADRLGYSQYLDGEVLKISKCSQDKDKDKDKKRPPKITIKTSNGLMKGEILNQTKLIKNKKEITCEALKTGMKVKLGYAQGNDIQGQQDFWIFDSIEILNNPSEK